MLYSATETYAKLMLFREALGMTIAVVVFVLALIFLGVLKIIEVVRKKRGK